MHILQSASKLAMLMALLAVIMLTAFRIDITEPMKTICLMIVSFYFGKGSSNDQVVTDK